MPERMSYGELIRLYFDRSNALQWYWTLYVVVIGGLLAISSFRRRTDRLLTVLVTVLYCFFAYKNLGAIQDASDQRTAILQSIRHVAMNGTDSPNRELRDRLEPTLVSPSSPSIRNFHVVCDLLTIAALWTMERRRRRLARELPTVIGAAG